MRIDVNAFFGHYPFRRVTGGSPQLLVEAMDRTGIDQAWISNLAAIFWKDPTEGNAVLCEWAGREPRFRPVPAIHPGLPHWERVLGHAVERGVPCVRADPTHYGIQPAGSEMRALAAACGGAGIPLMLAVRLEDQRQRHPNDCAAELDAADDVAGHVEPESVEEAGGLALHAAFSRSIASSLRTRSAHRCP